MNIVVVDPDREYKWKLAKDLLIKNFRKFDVNFFRDGESALNFLNKRNETNALIAEFHLPEMTAVEFGDRLNEDLYSRLVIVSGDSKVLSRLAIINKFDYTRLLVEVLKHSSPASA